MHRACRSTVFAEITIDRGRFLVSVGKVVDLFMKKSDQFLGWLLSLGFIVGIANASQIISLDFGNSAVQGAPVGKAAFGNSATDVWNLWSGPTAPNVGSTNLVYTTGLPSGASFAVENAPGAWVTLVPDLMFGIYAYSNGGPISVTFNDLPAGVWDVVAYGHGEQDHMATRFEVLTDTKRYGPLTTRTTSEWRTLPWVEGAHYVVLRNVEVAAGQSVRLIAAGLPGGPPFLNGVQLIARDSTVALEPNGALFTNRIAVVITGAAPGRVLRYTLDGSDPSTNSPVYEGPLSLNSTVFVAVRAFANGEPVSPIVRGEFVRIYAIQDGISNEWRRRYFGPGYLTDPRVSAEADPDADGANNLQEFVAGTDPLDPLSGFALTAKRVVSLSWASVPGRKYRILRKNQISQLEWEVYREVVAEGATARFTDEEAPDNAYFYAVEPVQ